MSGIIHRENWPKRRALLCASLSLCVLITFCVLVPYAGESAARDVASPLSISCYFQNDVLVSVASTVRNNLQRANGAKDNIESRTASTHGSCMTSQTYFQFVANLYRNVARFCSLAGVSEIGLHRACELLDIPPPSNTLSF